MERAFSSARAIQIGTLVLSEVCTGTQYQEKLLDRMETEITAALTTIGETGANRDAKFKRFLEIIFPKVGGTDPTTKENFAAPDFEDEDLPILEGSVGENAAGKRFKDLGADANIQTGIVWINSEKTYLGHKCPTIVLGTGTPLNLTITGLDEIYPEESANGLLDVGEVYLRPVAFTAYDVVPASDQMTGVTYGIGVVRATIKVTYDKSTRYVMADYCFELERFPDPPIAALPAPPDQTYKWRIKTLDVYPRRLQVRGTDDDYPA